MTVCWILRFLHFLILVFLQHQFALVAAAEEEVGDSERQAAIRMMQAYYEMHARNLEPDVLYDDVKMLFGDKFPEHVLDEMIEEAQSGSAKVHYADRLIHKMMDIIRDPDCMEREFDVKDPDYDHEEAAGVFRKCKLLVLRNVFEPTFLNEYKANFTKFLHSLDQGRISPYGGTTNGENFFMTPRSALRWEVILPRELAHTDLLMNEEILEVLMDDQNLGQGTVVHSFGTNIAESGAGSQPWHYDMPYLFDDSSMETHGIGGHDLPSSAVTVMIPVTNLTRAHGPTEFCLGYDAMRGMRRDHPIWDKALEDDPLVQTYRQSMDDYNCLPSHWRSPIVNFGDALLWDDQMFHRGGRNDSNEMRAIVHATYARSWYKDSNFRDMRECTDIESCNQRLLSAARFAIPDEMDLSGDCDTTDLEHMRDFLLYGPREEHRFDNLDEERLVAVSNKDMGPVHLYLDGEQAWDEPLDTGDTVLLESKSGELLEIKGSEGQFLKSYLLYPLQSQIMLDKEGCMLETDAKTSDSCPQLS